MVGAKAGEGARANKKMKWDKHEAVRSGKGMGFIIADEVQSTRAVHRTCCGRRWPRTCSMMRAMSCLRRVLQNMRSSRMRPSEYLASSSRDACVEDPANHVADRASRCSYNWCTSSPMTSHVNTTLVLSFATTRNQSLCCEPCHRTSALALSSRSNSAFFSSDVRTSLTSMRRAFTFSCSSLR